MREEVGRLGGGEAEIIRAQLHQLAARAVAVEGQGRVEPGGEQQAHSGGQVVQPEGHAFVDRGILDDMVVVQDQGDGRAGLGQQVDQFS